MSTEIMHAHIFEVNCNINVTFLFAFTLEKLYIL